MECWSLSEFTSDFVSISPDAARKLVSIRIRTVGVDYLSVGRRGGPDGKETHEILLRAGVTIIEGLDLRGAPPGDYEMVCLPLRIVAGDGSPARALLRSIATS